MNKKNRDVIWELKNLLEEKGIDFIIIANEPDEKGLSVTSNYKNRNTIQHILNTAAMKFDKMPLFRKDDY